MIQGTWVEDAVNTASQEACKNYMVSNLFNKPFCAQPNGKYAEVLLIDKAKPLEPI